MLLAMAAPLAAQSYAAPPIDGLVTNEFAYWHRSPEAKISADWEMTSGSLFVRGGRFWTGKPDSCASPNAQSSNCTNSNVFRLNTRKRFAGDVRLAVKLKQLGDIHDRSCEAKDSCWHGTHLWLRYRSQYDLYYVSINRADGKVVIKRKVPCGPDNRGTYFVLGSYVPNDFKVGTWNSYNVDISSGADGNVTIKLYDDGKSRTVPVAVGTDRGGRNPNWSASCNTPGRYPSADYLPIVGPGAIGIRGDFANFEFTDFKVTPL